MKEHNPLVEFIHSVLVLKERTTDCIFVSKEYYATKFGKDIEEYIIKKVKESLNENNN